MGGGQEAAASTGPGASPDRAQRGLTSREDAEPLISQIEKPGPQSQQKKTKQGQREGAGEDGEDSGQPIPAPKLREEREGTSLGPQPRRLYKRKRRGKNHSLHKSQSHGRTLKCLLDLRRHSSGEEILGSPGKMIQFPGNHREAPQGQSPPVGVAPCRFSWPNP